MSISFAFALLYRAIILTIAWMGTSLLAVAVNIGIFVIFPVVQLFRRGATSVWKEKAKYLEGSLILLIGVWCLLIIINWIYTVPHDITAQANSVPPPRPLFLIHPPVEIEAHHSVSKPGNVSAICSLAKNLSPCQIFCTINNPDDSEVADVAVGFNGIYPYETHLAAGTETHMSIRRQETLPLPMTNGYIDKTLQVFSVEIPLIPAKTVLQFNLWTTAEANQKACEYLTTIVRDEQHRKINELVKFNRNLSADKMVSLQAKSTSLFIPGYLMSPKARKKIEFVNAEEERNAKEFDAAYKANPIPGKTCLIPIFAAERTDGSLQYFANAPPMMTWVFNRESLKQTKNRIETDPHPPDKYLCEPGNN